MHALRFLTLLWPGLPWLWLRGSVSGLVLGLAFAVSIDVAVLTTFIWPGLVELELTLGLWTAVTAIWLVSTVSATAAFPPPIAVPRHAEADALFARARDAYLSRDWLQAESRIGELLTLAPTDGEAQLLLGTLLRRVGRRAEAHDALEKLSRADAGGPWRAAIDRELARLAAADDGPAADDPVSLPIRAESGPDTGRSVAA